MVISKFYGKGKIPRLGSKFCGLQETVGPTDESVCMWGIGD